MIKLYTHDRVVHADDVFAAAILKLIHPELQVVRTRDTATLKAAAGQPDTFLLDIGGRYDPELHLFDHHQPEGAGWRNAEEREWPYATAGLVWKHYGAEAVRRRHPDLPAEDVDELVRYLDESVIKYIDAVDCGVRVKTAGPSLSGLIASFNPAWYEEDEDVFPLVLELAQVLLVNLIKRYAGKVMARDKVRKSQANGRVLVLDTCLPWTDVVSSEMPEVLVVVYPVGSDGDTRQWQLRAAVNPDMTPRLRLPQRWAGLEHKALAKASKVDSAVFCHRSGHLAGADSLEGALAMAESALVEHDRKLLRDAA